jgi:hypothetical protein
MANSQPPVLGVARRVSGKKQQLITVGQHMSLPASLFLFRRIRVPHPFISLFVVCFVPNVAVCVLGLFTLNCPLNLFSNVFLKLD